MNRELKKYKEQIDEKVKLFNKFNNNYNVYGGSTEKKVSIRLKQHVYDYNKDNTKEPITLKWKTYNPCAINIKIVYDNISSNESQKKKYYKLIKKIEDYLIKSLDKHFECVNKHKKDGTLKQTGGAGLQLDEGDVIKFYIIYGPL